MRIFGLPPATDRVGLLARNGLLGLAVASSSLALGPVNEQERSYNKYRPAQTQPKPFLLRLMSNPPANVKSTANLFHKQFVMKVDGKIEGSPLYASAVAIAGGIHNVLYVAPCTTPSLPSMPIPAAAFRAMAWHSHHRI